MNYILSHKKINVAEIGIDEETAAISRIGTVFAPEHIPIGITVTNGKINRGDLNDWWHGRGVPASRQNIRELKTRLNISTMGKLILKCFGLSLSDQYWMNPLDNPLDWDKVNFFDNPFSEDVGDAMFGNKIKQGNLNLMSPDNTSDGWLKKRWKIIDKKRCLIKGGSDPFWQQPLNEVMAAIITKRLAIPYVSYSLVWENELPYSVCENFISSDTELVSAFYIHNTMKIKDTAQLYNHYLNCCEELDIPDVRINLDKMLTIDYIIANNDRHLNNFGAIRNANTLEWISPAPLYDNGSSLWYNNSAENIIKLRNNKSQPFHETHEEQIKLVKDFSWLSLPALAGVTDDFYILLKKSPLIDEKRRETLCLALENRVKSLLNII